MQNQENGEREVSVQTEPWRQCLGDIFREDKKLLRQVAQRIGMAQVSIQRWLDGTSTPHNVQQTLTKVSVALPEGYQPRFLASVRETLPDFQINPVELPVQDVPSIFYKLAFQACTVANASRAFWAISSLLFQQIYNHLDPDEVAGITATIFQCTPSDSGEVKSLYVASNQTTDRSTPLRQSFPVLIGVENPIAWTITAQSPVLLTGADIPTILAQEEVRCVACASIRKHGELGGVLVVTSRLPDFFNSTRLRVIEQYAHAALLALSWRDFVSPDQVVLGTFPSIEEQQDQDRDFSFLQRARILMRPGMAHQEAERLALTDLEQTYLANHGAKSVNQAPKHPDEKRASRLSLVNQDHLSMTEHED